MIQDNIDKFISIINKYQEWILIPHYNPDPDAIGSAFGLQFILEKSFNIKSRIFFSGIIGRAENKKLIDVLEIPITMLKENEKLPDLPVVLLDTQPGTGNNPLRSVKMLKIIIDHHDINLKSKNISFPDIRVDFGSTCAIIYDYFKYFELKPSVNVATALFYGIKSDAVGKGRTPFKVDFNYLDELNAFISHEKLFAIENPKLPFDYYIHINKGMENSVIYDNFLVTNLGELENPDYISEIADFLIRFEKCETVLVMGFHKEIMQLSFRSLNKKINAGIILKKIIGNLGFAGGHPSNSGGRIYIKNPEDKPILSKKIITKALHILLGKITSGVPLLSLRDYLNY